MKKGIYKICERCGKEYYVSPSMISKSKYCSKACKDNIQAKITKTCESCGKEFIVSQSLIEQKYCSTECKYKPKKQIKLNCLHCGKEFTVFKSRKKPQFCSVNCVNEHKRIMETENRSYIKCANCGTEILKYHRISKTNKNCFCSKDCQYEYINKQVEVKCINCDKPFKVKLSRAISFNPKFCSFKCRKEYFYKEPHSELFYKSAFWKHLSYKCYGRDNFTCQNCGVKGVTLQAHHIIPRKQGGTDTLDNLITLCVSCHMALEINFR